MIPELDAAALGAISGIWVDGDCKTWLSLATPEGGRREVQASYRPFAWIRPPSTEVHVEGLHL